MTALQSGTTAPAKLSKRQKKQVLAGALGNAVEYVDWAIYASLATVFAPKFFPAGEDSAALLGALAIFAAGFIMRPVGGAVIGIFADRFGRKKGLALTILLMSTGGFMIALCPPFEQIGLFAPVILLVARSLQGFAAGGEYGTSSAYLVEAAPPGRRGYIGSFQQISITAGILLASGLSLLVTSLLSPSQLGEWGWRVAFAVAASLGLLVLWFRTTVAESASFEQLQQHSAQKVSPLKNLLGNHRRGLLRVVMYAIPVAVLHYIWIAYMPAFAHKTYGIPLGETLLSGTISSLVLIALLPIYGLAADRFGRKPLLLFCCGGNLLLAYPAFEFMGTSFVALLVFQLLAINFLAPILSNLAAFMAEQFPANVRTTGIGLPYAVTVAVFGGTAPYITTWMAGAGYLEYVWLYPATVAAIGVIFFATTKETSRLPLDD
jgi:MHS family alpha-ketoglutarate permease-like MFS transporter